MTEQELKQFAGTWRCKHRYPSRDDTGEDLSENVMKADVKGNYLVLHSEPNAEGSYMFIRLAIDDLLATGSWHETASVDGSFNGAMYSGAGQLIISDDGKRMKGKWAGIGYDHAANESKIYTGDWELAKEG